MRLAVVSAALVLLALPASATGAADATCKAKLRTLQRQNLALRQQLQTVIAQRNTARMQRDEARAQLTAAQNGVAGVIAGMTPDQVWGLLGFPIGRVLAAPPRYSTSYFSSGGNYESWTFTNCGFCVPQP
jgi:hypothetical protein